MALLVQRAKDSHWTHVKADPRLMSGFQVFKKARLSNRSHMDWLYIAPDGRKLYSFAAAMRFGDAALALTESVVCSACGSGEDEPLNDIVLCDGANCGLAFHQRCLPTPLVEVPKGEWLCPGCRRGVPGRVLGACGASDPQPPQFCSASHMLATKAGAASLAVPKLKPPVSTGPALPPGWTKHERRTPTGKLYEIFCGPSVRGRRGYAESLQGAWRIHRMLTN